MSRRALLVVAALAAAIAVGLGAPPALGLPGDPAVTAGSPADGAVVPPDPAGLEVRFPCPVYRITDAGSGLSFPGGPRDYGVTLATSPRKGADGRLADMVALGRGEEIPGSAGQCSARVGAGGSSRPQETPGTYHWQVWRLCSGCAGGYETGPVRRLAVRAAVVPRLALQGKAYAGFGVFVAVSVPGVPDRTPVEVQLRRGGTWTTVARAVALGGRAETAVVLPGGAQALRARMRLGSQDVVSAPLAVTVASASSPPVALSEGAYRGTGGSGTASARFSVAGRMIRSFSARVPMLCPGVQAGQFTTQVGTAIVGRIAVAPDGSFVGVSTGDRTGVRVRGRLRGAVVTGGRVELSVGDCVGNVAFQARRT